MHVLAKDLVDDNSRPELAHTNPDLIVMSHETTLAQLPHLTTASIAAGYSNAVSVLDIGDNLIVPDKLATAAAVVQEAERTGQRLAAGLNHDAIPNLFGGRGSMPLVLRVTYNVFPSMASQNPGPAAMNRMLTLILGAERPNQDLRSMIREVIADSAGAKTGAHDKEAVRQAVREALGEDQSKAGGTPALHGLEATVKEIKHASKRARDSSSAAFAMGYGLKTLV